MSPNPRGRLRYSDDDPDRGLKNLLFVLIGMVAVNLVLSIGLWIDRSGGESAQEPLEPVQQSSASMPVQSAPAQEPTPAGDEEPAEVEESPTRVQILNGCGVPGIAAKARDWLVRQGYDVRDVGNADRHDYSTSRILNRSGGGNAGKLLARELNIPEARVLAYSGSPSANLDLTFIIGHDYKQLPFAR